MAASNSRPVIFALLGVALLVVIVSLFYEADPNYKWRAHKYDDEGGQPYDSDLLRRYLKETRSTEGFEVLSGSFADNLSAAQGGDGMKNYVVHGPFTPEVKDLRAIEDFVSAGNQLFLLSGTPGEEILDLMVGMTRPAYSYQSSFPFKINKSSIWAEFEDASLEIGGNGLKFSHKVQEHEEQYAWELIELDENYDEYQELGQVEDGTNFFKADVGRGSLYVLTTPKMLCNYYLTEPEGKKYSDRLFSYLGPGLTYWDTRNWSNGYDIPPSNEGPFAFLLSRESLRLALYTIFVGTLIFLLIGTQRDRKAVPVISPKQSSSKLYVDTVSELHYAQKGHGHIFGYLIEQVDRFIRDRYRIKVDWKNEDSLAHLAKASGVNEALTKDLSAALNKGAFAPNITTDLLDEFYLQLNRFYKKAK